MNMSKTALTCLGWLASSLLAPCAMAQTQTTDLPNAMLGWRGIELYSSQNHLSNGYGNWRETGVRGIYETGQHQIAGEVASMTRFNQSGNYVGVGDTVVLDTHWYASLAVGGGDGVAYLPRYRADAFLHRKLLPDKNLVTSLGLGHYKSPDGHRDDNISLGATLYFEQPWILQAEIKHTDSKPGNVGTEQYFVAATWGRHKQTLVTGRYGWGEEGYQSLGGLGSIARFSSHQSTLTVQHWVGTNWGIKASAENYQNPYYRREGILLAVFRDLP
jgi:YaiO family outer membrane protein